MSAIIMSCACRHSEQDKMYGSNRRVFNQRGKGFEKLFRCSVCGVEKEKAGEKSDVAPAKKKKKSKGKKKEKRQTDRRI